MQKVKLNVGVITFFTNMMQADAPQIDIAHVVEAFGDNGHFIGVVHRDALSAEELDKINLETWPEMKGVASFVEEIMDATITTEPDKCIAHLAQQWPVPSALQVGLQSSAELEFADGVDINEALLEALSGAHGVYLGKQHRSAAHVRDGMMAMKAAQLPRAVRRDLAAVAQGEPMVYVMK